ncbi:MAG: FtsB family cell division protein [Thermoleophilaceae bacterium]
MASATATTRPRQRHRRRSGRTGVRWDRVGRIALLVTLGVILLLYISPAKHWLEQSSAARVQQTELGELERENAELKQRVRTLRDPEALALEARRLGMVGVGERAYVIQNLSE